MKYLKSYTKLFESKADNIVEDCKDILAELSDDNNFKTSVYSLPYEDDDLVGTDIIIKIDASNYKSKRFIYSEVSEYILRIFDYMNLNGYKISYGSGVTMIVRDGTKAMPLDYMKFDETDINKIQIQQVDNIQRIIMLFSEK